MHFLKKLEKEPITKEKKDKIEENLLYFFDILEDIPKEMSEEKYQNIVYKDAIEEILFENIKYTNKIIEVYNNINEKLIALEFKKKITSLDRKFENYQDSKVINYGKENKFKFAILTDGTIWRIYKLNTANYFETFIEINIESYIKTREIDFSISLLENFINQKNLIINKQTQKSNLDIFLENSDSEITRIEKELKSKMEDILSGIGLGLKESIGKEIFTIEESKELYNDSITILYRILFIIYAEAKNLLPINEEEYELLSFNKIIEDLKFEKENNETTLWKKIEKLFYYIDNGYIGKNIEIEAYNGGLFNNKERKYLGKYSISNKHLIRVLKKISFYEKGNKIIERIEFKDLSTRSFGTLYEGILDYNMFIASEDLVKTKEASKTIYVPLSKISAKKTDIIIRRGEIYLSEDAFERKDTGAYYTPEPIVEYITSNTIDIKIDEILNKNESFELELREIKEKINIEYDPLLKEALQEELYNKIISHIESEILTIPILDNAMGSGHFLVNATYHMASKIYSFIHKHIDFEVLVEEEKTYDFSYWLRKVVTHNIYGVDINNLAVQLGKLSLWLISASKDKPLSFLDHHLKCGNSLFGTTRKDIDETLGDNLDITKSNNRTLFDITIDNLMSKLDLKFKELEKMPENTKEEIHNKEDFYCEEIQKEIEDIKVKWNIYLAMQISNKDGIVEKKEYDKIVNLEVEEIEKKYPEYNYWQELIKKNQVFHWELEFPEVFTKNKKGFEIVIGNPPYIGEDGNKEIFRTIAQTNFGNRTYMGKMDYFYFFFHKGIDLLRESGTLSFITTNYFLTADGAKRLREDLKNRTTILSLSNFNEFKIFDSARGQHNIITVLKKENLNIASENFICKIKETKEIKNIRAKALERILNKESEKTEYFSINQDNLYEGENNFIRINGVNLKTGTELDEILSKMMKEESKLKNFVQINQGVVSGCDKASSSLLKKLSNLKDIELNDGIYVYDTLNLRDLQFIDSLTIEEKELLKPFFKNSEIDRYIANEEPKKYLLYLNKDIKEIEMFTNIKKYIDKFKEALMERREAKNGKIKYFQLQWGREKEIFFGEKLVCPYRSKVNIFACVEKEWFCRSDVYIMKSINEDISLKYLLALLNSKLYYIWLFYKGKKKGDTLELFPTSLNEIPIKNISKKEQNKYIEIVEKIIELRRLGENTDNLENQINYLVYDLFELTEDEIKYLENYEI